MKLEHFTKEQIMELSRVFGIKIKSDFKVRDGYVGIDDMVWWHCSCGPEHVKVSSHVVNIKNYPEYYSIEEPAYTIKYSYE